MRIGIVGWATIFALAVVTANAGFLDGIKQIGGGIAESAGSAFDSAVNVTTSTVQRISTNQGDANSVSDQQKPDAGQVASQNGGTGKAIQPMIKQQPSQSDKEQARRKRAEEERERRYQAEQERQRKGREQWKKENREKEERERAEQKERERKRYEERERERAEREDRDRTEREKKEREKNATRLALEEKKAKEKEDMIQALKITVTVLKELHDSPELDEFVKWDEDGSRFHGSQYKGNSARERAYDKIRREADMDRDEGWVDCSEHWFSAETLAEVPSYMTSYMGRGGISIPKTVKGAEFYKASIGKVLEKERKIVHDKKAVLEKIAKVKADAENAERKALAQAHETVQAVHAKAAGSPDGYQFNPVPVYRNVKLGMSAKEVCAVLDLKDSQGFIQDASDYEKWIGGKARKVTFKAHTVYLQFADICGDKAHPQYLLISAQLEFNDKDNAPEATDVCAKYTQLSGVKVSKDRKVIGHVWKDNVNAFWHVLYDTAMFQVAMTEQTGTGEHGPLTEDDKIAHGRLKLDLETIREEFMTPTYESIDVFSVDGMQICVNSDLETQKTSLVTFEDVLMSDMLKKIKKNAEDKKAKDEANAKAEAKKKAKAAAVDF